MATVVPLPQRGEVLLDARGEGRSLRLSWHHDAELVVLSLWRGATCSASFRLPTADVPALLAALADGLAVELAGRLPAGRDQRTGAAGVRSKARGIAASSSGGSIAR